MVASPPAQIVALAAGAVERRIAVARPSGVILRFRVTVPHGARVVVEGRIPRVAGVRLSTAAASCARRGPVDVCEQPGEWCPMPRALWRFVVRKLDGPAGPLRLEFVVGPAL